MKRRMEEEEREREIRTNEDPYLVGEEAAEKNRQERLRRENGWGVLEGEDKRWDVSIFSAHCFSIPGAFVSYETKILLLRHVYWSKTMSNDS